MTPFKNALACLVLSLVATSASAEGNTLQGHQLRLSAVDQPDVNWITQEDVRTAERVNSRSNGQPVLRLNLKTDAAQRMKALTSSNIGKKVRFTWDGTVVSELTVASGFGSPFELPAPPK